MLIPGDFIGDLCSETTVEINLGFNSFIGEAVTDALLTAYLLELSRFLVDFFTLSLVLFWLGVQNLEIYELVPVGVTARLLFEF